MKFKENQQGVTFAVAQNEVDDIIVRSLGSNPIRSQKGTWMQKLSKQDIENWRKYSTLVSVDVAEISSIEEAKKLLSGIPAAEFFRQAQRLNPNGEVAELLKIGLPQWIFIRYVEFSMLTGGWADWDNAILHAFVKYPKWRTQNKMGVR